MRLDLDHAWAVEQACHNARPSAREIVLAGRWLLRLEGGATRRANAVSPLRGAYYDPRPVIETASRIYRTQGQPCIFRVPSIAPGLDARLEAAGFAASDPISTLVAGIREPPPLDPDVTIAAEPPEAWLAATFRMTPKVGATPHLYRAMVAEIAMPKAFVALLHCNAVVGVAYGAVSDGILVAEAVVIDPTMRRRGFGRRLVGTLLGWAWLAGARAACLQVESDNAPALALYRSLGFHTELYRYHYRIEPT